MHEIEFQLEPADLVAWYLSSWDDDRAHRIACWASGLVVAGVGAVKADELTASVLVSAVTAIAGFGLGWVVARAALRSYVRGHVRKLATSAQESTQIGSYRLSVDSAGVSEIGPASQHRHAWQAVLGVKETADHLFVLIAGGSAHVIPKRAFGSAAQLEAFRAVVERERAQFNKHSPELQ